MNAREESAMRNLMSQLRLSRERERALEKELAALGKKVARAGEKRAAVAWREAREANARVEELVAKLARIDVRPKPIEFMTCPWCGIPCLGPACWEHFDLQSTADVLEEALGA